jgi:two-component system CheB/CheR fusion protein
MANFPINDLLLRMRDEFTYHANASRLALHVVPCSLSVHSDPRLLEQMIRNLLSTH